MIRDKGLNRVVIAACTPRTHEPLFRDTVREGGINQYFLDMANIREHCSWVHSREKDDATAKAKDIVRMSVARTSLLQPLKEIDLPINKAVLVIGGGVAGMTSALNMAEQGFEVYLWKKPPTWAAWRAGLHYTLEGVDVQAYLNDLIGKVYRHPAIHVATDTTIQEVAGYVGNFTTKVRLARTDQGNPSWRRRHRHRCRGAQAGRISLRPGRARSDTARAGRAKSSSGTKRC